MLEFWRAGGSPTLTPVETARRVEAEGWDGQMFMDSQSLGAEAYVMMGAWAVATKRLKLSTGVTNPLSRHPVVTAAAAATLQAISGGRAVLGIGRGDSALANLGYGPVTLGAFRRTLQDLQVLLGGGEVAFTSYAAAADAPPLESLSLGERPGGARLHWLPAGAPKVPLDVAATGPKVIEMAAQMAERLTFSVGAIAERLSWALDLARAARRRQQLPEQQISYGAQVIVICHPDIEAMRAFATSSVAALARFQVIQGAAAGPTAGDDAANLEAIHRSYDMTQHGQVLSDRKLKGAQLSWDFINRFAIVGPPEYCVQRLLELAALGIERFVIVGPGFHPESTADGGSLFARQVIPALRARLTRGV
jgi:5,10-methylenetetrahydromethanopterin reductase